LTAIAHKVWFCVVNAVFSYGLGHFAQGGEAAPYDTGDVHQVLVRLPSVSMQVRRILNFSHAGCVCGNRCAAVVDEVLAERIHY
jgi:hypothetical protein